ncbi:MAG: hypothetical protein EZS28_015777 [Streblomastix strix]|uniref:Uncharacterized protein n=1 Tax=Streblomastix strix TaxID=222440 RepID=A0A5J4W175_9EUKA|nr:MAG: hypothetical protein EZS28_015777 [Streblomastix strix]
MIFYENIEQDWFLICALTIVGKGLYYICCCYCGGPEILLFLPDEVEYADSWQCDLIFMENCEKDGCSYIGDKNFGLFVEDLLISIGEDLLVSKFEDQFVSIVEEFFYKIITIKARSAQKIQKIPLLEMKKKVIAASALVLLLFAAGFQIQIVCVHITGITIDVNLQVQVIVKLIASSAFCCLCICAGMVIYPVVVVQAKMEKFIDLFSITNFIIIDLFSIIIIIVIIIIDAYVKKEVKQDSFNLSVLSAAELTAISEIWTFAGTILATKAFNVVNQLIIPTEELFQGQLGSFTLTQLFLADFSLVEGILVFAGLIVEIWAYVDIIQATLIAAIIQATTVIAVTFLEMIIVAGWKIVKICQ